MFTTIAPTGAAFRSRFVNARIDRLVTSRDPSIAERERVGASSDRDTADVTRRPFGRRTRTAVLGAVACAGVLLVCAGQALALGQLSYDGCVSVDGSGGLCAASGSPSLAGGSSVAISPDGTSAYVTSYDTGAIATFNRAAAGQLAYAGCISDDGSAGLCTDLPGDPLAGALSVAVSPDDGSLYTTGFYAATVVHLFRKTAPDTRIASGPAEGATAVEQRPTFAFASDQDGATFECSVDGRPFVACVTPGTLGPLTSGDHRLAVRAVTGGDADRTPATRTFRIDAGTPVTTTGPGIPPMTATPGVTTPAPRVRIVHGPKAAIHTHQASVKVRFTLTVDQAGATLRCTLDSRPSAPCRSPLVYVVRTGRHHLVVQATDRLGHAGRAVRRSFSVIRTRRSTHS